VSKIEIIASNGDCIEVETNSYILVAIDINGNIVVTSADDSNMDLTEGLIQLSETALRNHAKGNIHYDEPDYNISIKVHSDDMPDDGKVNYTDYMLMYVSTVNCEAKTASHISGVDYEGMIYNTMYKHMHKVLVKLDEEINAQFNKLTGKNSIG
jgi:hypothetical protein